METAVAYYKDGVPYDDKGQVIITLLNGTPDGSGSGGGLDAAVDLADVFLGVGQRRGEGQAQGEDEAVDAAGHGDLLSASGRLPGMGPRLATIRTCLKSLG